MKARQPACGVASTQAASNCGPLNASGSKAENICAKAPFGQISRRRVEIQTGRRSGGLAARIPDGPKTITSRAWSSVSPTSATARAAPSSNGPGPSTIDLTHSAPARVLPAPRPPMQTQVRQSPSGGSWWSCAQNSKEKGAPPALPPQVRPGTHPAASAAAMRSSRSQTSARAAARSRSPATAIPSFRLCFATRSLSATRPRHASSRSFLAAT